MIPFSATNASAGAGPGRPNAPRHNRLISLALVFLLGFLAAPASAQKYAWARKHTNTAGKTAVVADRAGNSYVLTAFTGTITIGAYSYTSYGGADLFLMKYAPDGTLQWIRRIAGTGDEQVGDVILSSSEYQSTVYVTGSFRNTVKFENKGLGVSPLTSAGQSDIFLAEYSTKDGTFYRARRAGGTGDDHANGLALDPTNNVYVTGSFTGTMKFNLGLLTLSVTSSGQSDVFVARYSLFLDLQMVRRLGGPGYDLGTAIAVNPNNGDFYVTGGYSPGTNPFVSNVLVAKYNAAGTWQWQKTPGAGNSVDLGADIVAGDEGVFVTGYFGGSIDFDGHALTSAGSADAFLAYYRFDLAKASRATSMGGTGWDEGQTLAYTRWWDMHGNNEAAMYLGGVFSGTASFGSTKLSALGTGQDLFLARLDDDGYQDWVQRLGSYGHDYGRGGIALANPQTLLLTGHYGDAIKFGTTILPGQGSFLTRIDVPYIADFSLINAATEAVLGTDRRRLYLNYSTMTKQFNVRANVFNSTTGSVTTGSVKFEFTPWLPSYTTDNGYPYTLAGDQAGAAGPDYLACPVQPTPGYSYTMYVTPYSGPNGTGMPGTRRELTLEVSDKPEVTGLALVNAVTDADIQPALGDWYTIYYSKAGTNQFNVRATTNPGKVGSVVFILDGKVWIENAAPYALAGDVLKAGGGTDYKPLVLTAGKHNLTVRAYTGPGATGTASDPRNVSLEVVADKAFRVAAEAGPETESPAFTVAPNPFTERAQLTFTPSTGGPATVEVYNVQGVRVQRLFGGTLEAGKPYAWTFDGSRLPGGVYLGRIKLGGRVLHQRLVLTR